MKAKTIMAAIAVAMLAVALANPAEAAECRLDNNGRAVCLAVAAQKTKPAERHRKRVAAHRKAAPIDANGNGIVTVETAAGIPIRVAADFAEPIKAVIADLVARGIKPKQIHCLAHGGHVAGSRHYSGHACDFDFYRGCMGCSAKWTRHIGDIVARHGLRNGCSFGDCGHIDDGRQLARRHRHHYAMK